MGKLNSPNSRTQPAERRNGHNDQHSAKGHARAATAVERLYDVYQCLPAIHANLAYKLTAPHQRTRFPKTQLTIQNDEVTTFVAKAFLG